MSEPDNHNSDESLYLHRDLLDAKDTDFPWSEIFARLDGDDAEQADRNYVDLSFALTEILTWITQAKSGALNPPIVAQRRAVSILWLIRPDLFDGSPSLTALAKKLSIHKVALSVQSATARRRFRIRNRASAHASNFQDRPAATPDEISTDEDTTT